MSQGDESADVSQKENFSHNCELEETLCTARTTARLREGKREIESRAQQGAGLGTPDNRFHKCMPQAFKFP